MKIGFIGLGQMGSGMAHNLVRAGHDVSVYNRTKEKTKRLADAGATVASSPGELAGAEIVVTMLADDAAVESVALDGERPSATFAKGALHLSMSTISPALVARLARAHGASFVSAPVFGRPDAAAAAKLFVLAAGPKASVARCRPLLDAMGQKTFELGEDPVAANVLKLSGNFLLAATIEAMAETFALARKWGLDAQQVLDVLTSTLFTAPVHKGYGAKIAAQSFDAKGGFALVLGLKDVKLVLGAADDKRVPMPTASLLRDRLTTAASRGLAEQDWSALGKLAADDAGL